MKFSKYNYTVEVDKGLVLYNSKMCAYVNIFKEKDIANYLDLLDMESIPENNDMVQALYKHGYVVDDDVDEYEEVRGLIKNKLDILSETFSAMIYVTDKCNFRCVYCPQKHNPNVLSDESWNAIYKHIEKNVISGKYKHLQFKFFGGEPLLEKKAILNFMKKIKQLKEQYPYLTTFYKMTTNAYLLTPNVYDELNELGFNSYQITLDGFKKTHDIMRPQIDGQGTWDVIVTNLKYINNCKDDISIVLRMNTNKENACDVNEFLEWLNKTFTADKFYFDIIPVSKFSDNVDDNYISDISYNELQKASKQYGRYAVNPVKSLTLLGSMCECARKSYYVISAKGELAKCEQAYDEKYDAVGYFDNDGEIVTNENYDVWTKNYETENCSKCYIYPMCGAMQCPRKKARYPKERSDCSAFYEDVMKDIVDLIRTGYLHPDHVCNAMNAE